MNLDTSLYDKTVGKIFDMHMLFSEPLILGGKLSPDPFVIDAQETGYPNLNLVLISLCSTCGLPSPSF